MSKAIEYAKQIEGVTEEGGFCDPEFMPLVSKELRRLAAVEKQLEAAQAELAACKSRCNASVGQADALRAELADIRALEPAGWFKPSLVDWRGNPVRWDQLVHGHGTPLYALPEQK